MQEKRRLDLIPDKGPRRVLAAAQLVNNFGNGLFMTGQALFFTRSVGLPVSQVAFGLGVSALFGLVGGVPVGRLADRRGSRETYTMTMFVQGFTATALVFVHSFVAFLVAVCLIQFAQAASLAARGPMIRALGGDNPAQFRAYLRSLTNVGITVGGAAATAAIQIDTRPAYLTLVLGDAATFFVCAALVSRLPHVAPVPEPAQANRWIALRDLPYLSVTVLDGLMGMQYAVLVFALPLWLVGDTHAPRWFISAALLTNTLMCVLLQVRASRGIDTADDAGRAMRRAGLTFLFSTALFAMMEGLPGWAAGLIVLPAAAIHTVGELWQASAGFELSYGLAAPHAQGQYTGVYNMGFVFANAVGPPVLGALCITWGRPGWFVLGAIFASLGLVIPGVVKWAERTRPASETA
ncbi:MFS family permease [Streptomyces griseochromogenes]|uniref:MFS family permease n=1 Tax=Streptomyces griseochromogenes TaxID=68214 RepID=A0ABS4LKR9_9ACTN|nr:MFS transporter [Streptomyces griseochromogenes]MBP2047981.1 MFS family permease [Streptomyces griseochromogenes]